MQKAVGVHVFPDVSGPERWTRARILILPADATLVAEHRKDLLGGVTVIRAKDSPAITAILFNVWSNRGDGERCLWLPAK